MDIRDVDLNLLVVFDALLRTRSVTRAAAELGMSQPATSFALNRLRATLGDPLFVRTARGIHPTPHAERLAEPLTEILDSIRGRLLQQPTFVPEQAERTVTMNMPDIGELVFLPRILKRLSEVAPKISLQTVNLPDDEIEPALRSGAVDLALGFFPRLQSAALYQQRLFTHSFVCVVRRDHPRIGDKMTRKQFIESDHAVVAGGHADESLEAELRAQGLVRRVVLRVEHFLALPTILSETDLIFTVPYAIGASLAKLADIKLVQPPFKAKPRAVKQHWHSRFHHDPANRWLRGLVADLFAEHGGRVKRPWMALEAE
jgi:DNA-binding transcriptional LysR family regulator